MTATELRTSINSDLSVLGVDALESISRYVGRLATHARNQRTALPPSAPRKIHISGRIRRMSGRFSVPADFDCKTAKADMLDEKYRAQ